MKFTIAALTAFVSLVSSVALPNALPEAEPGVSIARRTVGGVSSPHVPSSQETNLNPLQIFLCDDINWGGNCGYAVQPLYTCINMGTDWNDKISSFGPDSGTTCLLFRNSGCSQGQFFEKISNPGSADLRNEGINDQISSFQCYPSGGNSGLNCYYCAPYQSYCSIVDCVSISGPGGGGGVSKWGYVLTVVVLWDVVSVRDGKWHYWHLLCQLSFWAWVIGRGCRFGGWDMIYNEHGPWPILGTSSSLYN